MKLDSISDYAPQVSQYLFYIVQENYIGIQFVSCVDHMWKYLTGADLSSEWERGYD